MPRVAKKAATTAVKKAVAKKATPPATVKKSPAPAAPVTEQKGQTLADAIKWAEANAAKAQEFVDFLRAFEVDGDSATPAEESAPAKSAKAPAKKAAAKPVAKKAPKEEDPRERFREKLAAMNLAALRKLALEADFESKGVKEASEEELIEGLLADDDALALLAERYPEGDEDEDADETDEDESDEGENEDEDEEEDEDQEAEEAEVTREELEALSLDELVAIAKEAGFSKSDYKGKEEEELIAMILGEDEEEEGDEDEDEEEGDDEDYWTRDSLIAQGRVALRKMLSDDFDPPIKTSRTDTVEDMADAYLAAAGAE